MTSLLNSFVLIFMLCLSMTTFLCVKTHGKTDDLSAFKSRASALSEEVKIEMLRLLQDNLRDDSTGVKAFNQCQTALPDLKKKLSQKYPDLDYGRFSHKLRQPLNLVPQWGREELKQFQSTFRGKAPRDWPIIKIVEGKKVYLEPLYTMPLCLTCHGDAVSGVLKSKILEKYPNDQARGFKAAEFRGFLWVSEKNQETQLKKQ